MRAPTISEVAKTAGVSVATVSRVVNGSPSVSHETQARVQEAIERLGYQPNVWAGASGGARAGWYWSSYQT